MKKDSAFLRIREISLDVVKKLKLPVGDWLTNKQSFYYAYNKHNTKKCTWIKGNYRVR